MIEFIKETAKEAGQTALAEMCLNLYDIAAGTLLVEEAGGRVSDMSGGRDFPQKGLFASNGLIHEKLMSYFE